MPRGPLRLIKTGIPEIAVGADERVLILAAQQGDSSAFKDLYERYKERVHTVIYYSLNDIHHSEDVLQTVFVKVFQSLPRFRFESNFPTWLFKIALNECRNRNRRRGLFVSFSQFVGILDQPDPSASPEALLASRQSAHMVQSAIAKLKPELREVIVLKYLEELSYEEMASVLGCSSGTVASRLHRALAALEAHLRH